jgi:hypothetical protein
MLYTTANKAIQKKTQPLPPDSGYRSSLKVIAPSSLPPPITAFRINRHTNIEKAVMISPSSHRGTPRRLTMSVRGDGRLIG